MLSNNDTDPHDLWLAADQNSLGKRHKDFLICLLPNFLKKKNGAGYFLSTYLSIDGGTVYHFFYMACAALEYSSKAQNC